MKKNISLTAALLLSTTSVFAQDAILLDEIVVSAGIQDISINRTGASVDVIEAETLDTAGSSMTNALETVAGVAMNSNGGLGAQTGIRLRGLSQNYVAVRIDGIDYSDPTGTQASFDFGGMTTAGFDRLEVLKGSQSAIYGSEAIGGVVSFKTNTSRELGQKMTLGMEVGTYNSRTYNMKISNVTETGSTALVLVKTATDGFSAKSDNDEADAHSKTEIRMASEMDLSDQLTLGLSALMSSSETDYDGYTSMTDHVSSSRNGLGVNMEYRGDVITHQLAWSRSITDRFDINGWNNSFIGVRDTASYTANMTIGIADISIGAEKTTEEANIDGVSTTDIETAYFGEAVLGVTPDMDVTVSTRSSDSDEFGTANVYRVAAAYRLNETTTLRALASSGYRAPSQYERYGYGGNPDFKPETSTNYEIGLSHAYANGEVQATYFDNTINDVINYNSTTWAYEQLGGKTKSKGLELSGRFALTDGVSVFGSYTYTESKNGDIRVVRVPKHDLSFGVDASFGTTHLGATVKVAKDIEDIVWPDNVAVDDFTVVNLSAAYDLSDMAQAYVRIENAFDTDYETVKGYNTGGRMIYAGLRASF